MLVHRPRVRPNVSVAGKKKKRERKERKRRRPFGYPERSQTILTMGGRMELQWRRVCGEKAHWLFMASGVSGRIRENFFFSCCFPLFERCTYVQTAVRMMYRNAFRMIVTPFPLPSWRSRFLFFMLLLQQLQWTRLVGWGTPLMLVARATRDEALKKEGTSNQQNVRHPTGKPDHLRFHSE